jgi:hypothetical protein
LSQPFPECLALFEELIRSGYFTWAAETEVRVCLGLLERVKFEEKILERMEP